ncbi:nickel-responsive transcriptional regulator NikR (plasmid) [Comamonadaceae bacterium OTU4NAUVB1]|nr:nickel-responsive transcriptional regulator NikR [Comamonadaceae bacterium OTU4NAUVB1]
MQRFTISLDDELAAQFDKLIASKGYVNRSEAVRDLIRTGLGRERLITTDPAAPPAWCVANVSYVYDHHEQTITSRMLALQHDHHDLVITSSHTHLDHDHCLETVVLRGPLDHVRACAEQLVALRGIRHGNVHLVPLAAADSARHSHGHLPVHDHFKPIN